MASDIKSGEAKELDRKTTILRAAIDVFATKGYHGCRIADVAREAKVAYGLVYHYFKNKDELLQSVFRTGFDFFLGKIRDAIAQGDTLEEKVRRICALCFEAYRRDPHAVRVLVLQVARSPAIGVKNRLFAFEGIIRVTADMFVEAKERGELREELDPLLCALFLFGALEMGLTSLVAGMRDAAEPGALEQAERQVAAVFLQGVMAPEAMWKRASSSTRSKAARRS